MSATRPAHLIGLVLILLARLATPSVGLGQSLKLDWKDEILTIRGPRLPGGEVSVWYLEAFCRPGSTGRDWKETVIPHRTQLIERAADGTRLRLRSVLDDGVAVDSEIRASDDEVDFRVVASNPGRSESEAHWAQPCIRVDRFTGVKSERNSEAYLPSCFVFLDGKPTRLPTRPWAREARYTPGQVWCPSGVSREDVNPRPLSPLVPSNGLIGCVSHDGSTILATAWEPYQELFQGIIVCLHSDFRIGGLRPGESKSIRGKLYLVPADFPALQARYERDFPEHKQQRADQAPSARTRKLIEFGWDEPDTAFLKAHQGELERTPFDGCVFHAITSTRGKADENFTWLCWGKRRFGEGDLAAAFADLRSIRWTRFRDNFLRFNVTPGDLDWFEDHEAVMANARLAARLAREGHCRGILLDTEQYEKGLFNYRKQRRAATTSWEAYAAQVRVRGEEFMAALQEGFPGLRLMTTFGPSLAWKQGDGGKVPLAERDYGLIVPFFDGMIAASRGETRIVDGYELSYGYRDPAQFDRGRQIMTVDAAGLMIDPRAYARLVRPGFGLWMDYDWRKRGWKADDPEANYFSPARFRTALRAALERADEFVWVYTETPRWWTPAGKPAQLPEAYAEAVRDARRGLCRD
ncbi:MAG: hypothetical protein U0790_26795 [Isosphaeraceae bacterium]